MVCYFITTKPEIVGKSGESKNKYNVKQAPQLPASRPVWLASRNTNRTAKTWYWRRIHMSN